MHNGVIVAGMHRSGTSAMTRVLNLLGCALPGDLIEADFGNTQGHWESLDVVALNDRILAAAGSSWDDWSAVNADWRASAAREDAVENAAIVVREHCKLGRLFVMKDPRMSKLIDVWTEAFDREKVKPTLIITLRNPLEVSASLEARDLMAPAYSNLLWLRYMLDLEYYSRGRTRVVCRYEALLENWSGTIGWIKEKTGLTFPANSPLAQDKIEQFLEHDSRHYHHNAKEVLNNTVLSTWLRQAYAVFLRWSEDGEDETGRVDLDEIRAAIDHAAPAFARLILPGTQSELAGNGNRLKLRLEEQLEQARTASTEAERLTADAADLRQQAQAREAELNAQIEERSNTIATLNAEASALREQLAAVEIRASETDTVRSRETELTVQIGDLQSTVDALQRELQDEQATRAQRESAAADANRELELAREALAATEGRAASLGTELEAQAVAVTNANAEVAELQAELARLQEAVPQAETHAATEAELALVKQQLDGAEGRAAALATDLQERLRAADEANAVIATLTAEVAALAPVVDEAAAAKQREAELTARLAEFDEALRRAVEERDAERDLRASAEQHAANLESAINVLQTEASDTTNQLAVAESTLAQRREELTQLWKELETTRADAAEADRLRAELEARSEKLREANDWVFQLSADRRTAEVAERAARVELTRESHARGRLEGQVAALSRQLADALQTRAEQLAAHDEIRNEIEQRLARSQEELERQGGSLRDANAEIDGLRSQLEAARRESEDLHRSLTNRSADVAAAKTALAVAEQNLADHFSEVATLVQMLRTTTTELETVRQQKEADGRIASDLTVVLRERDEELGLVQAAHAFTARELADRTPEVVSLTETHRELVEQLEAQRQQVQERTRTEAELSARLQAQTEKLLLADAARASAEQALANASGTAGVGSASSDPKIENRLTELLQKRDEEVGAANAARGAAERQLRAHFSEVATLTKLLRDAASDSDASKGQSQWLRRFNTVSAGFPRWWALMPASWRMKRAHARYAAKGLFNAEKYLQLYPDVAASGMDPVRHYIIHGMDENRRNPI